MSWSNGWNQIESMYAVTDPATNAAAGTAIVNVYNGVLITTTTTGNSQTLQSPSATAVIKYFTVANNDTSTNTIPVVANSITYTIAVGSSLTFMWDGSKWFPSSMGITAIPVTVPQGGTGLATITDHGIMVGSGTGAITPLTVLATGEILLGATGADPKALAAQTVASRKFFHQTGTGTAGQDPTWEALISSDLTTPLTTPPPIGGTTANTAIFAPGTELISNGTFTSGVSGWTPNTCTLASVAGGQAGNCLEITRTSGDLQYAYQAVTDLTVGNKYELSAYVKSGTSGNEEYYVILYDSSGAVTIESVTGTSSGSWVQSGKIIFTASETSHVVSLMKNTATAGTMLFDTVSLKQIPLQVTGEIATTTVNQLTLAKAAVGFTIAGGTTSKTLTIPLDATVSGTNTGDITLATNHGLGLTNQVLNMGTPSSVTGASTNSVTTTTHTHALDLTAPGAIGGTTAGTIRALLDEDLEPAADTLTANQLSGGQINNTGQGANDVNLTLPAAAEGYNFIAQVGEPSANYWRFTAATAGTMIVDGVVNKDYAQFATPGIGNYFVARTAKVAPQPAGILTGAALAIGGTKSSVATGAFTYYIAGTKYAKGAVAAGTAMNAVTTAQNKYGCQALDIGTDGTIDAISCTNIAAGLDSAVLAYEDLPAVAASHVRIGYVTAMSSDAGGFVWNTTLFDDAAVTEAYTSTAAYTATYNWIVTTGSGTVTTN